MQIKKLSGQFYHREIICNYLTNIHYQKIGESLLRQVVEAVVEPQGHVETHETGGRLAGLNVWLLVQRRS